MSNETWIKHAYPLQKITIQLQGTRHNERKAVINQLEIVLNRLQSGDLFGESHDDDYGYRFFTEPESGNSFFDAAARDI